MKELVNYINKEMSDLKIKDNHFNNYELFIQNEMSHNEDQGYFENLINLGICFNLLLDDTRNFFNNKIE
ncbi:MAG: hypothetical protein ACRCTA_00285 [Bacilli bacterium]